MSDMINEAAEAPVDFIRAIANVSRWERAELGYLSLLYGKPCRHDDGWEESKEEG